MMTSSPGLQTAAMALKQDCLAPLLTMIWLGLYSSLLSARNFSEMAWRSSGMPELGVYFVNPLWRASMAAALICSGVSMSGSPAPKPQTSNAFRFQGLGFAVDREGERWGEFLTRVASSMVLER